MVSVCWYRSEQLKMLSCRSLAGVCLLSCLAAFTATAGTVSPFSLDLSALGGSAAFHGTTVASGLDFPYGMALTPNGSILWGKNTPLTIYGIEAPVTSALMVLARNADGSFAAPQQIAGNINGPITNIRGVNGLTVVDAGAASGRTMTFYDQNFNQTGSVAFSYATQDWWHSTGMSAIAQQPDGSYKVFFIVGSEADGTKTTDKVTTSGLFQTTLNADSVYMVTLSNSGGTLQAIQPPVQVATGLRNPYGLVVDPGGNLLIGENGQDGTHANGNELSADGIDFISAARLGTSITDFGFPDSYTNFFSCQRTSGNPNAALPLAAFCAITDSYGLDRSEGLAGMAYVNAGAMPFAGAQGGLLVGFHGAKNATGSANYENAFLYYDFASGIYTPIVHTGTSGVGHLDTVLVDGSNFFVADMATLGVVDGVGGENSGTITEFSFAAAPEPGTFALSFPLLALLAVIRGRIARGRT